MTSIVILGGILLTVVLYSYFIIFVLLLCKLWLNQSMSVFVVVVVNILIPEQE